MIVCCGYSNVDLTAAVPELLGAGMRVQATAIHRGEGGMAANAAVAAARMGATVRFAGVVGPDDQSTSFLNALVEDGLDVEWTSRSGLLTTSIVLLTPDGERAIISQDDQLTTEHIAETVRLAQQTGADWLYLDGYRFPAAAEVLAGVTPGVVVDLDGASDRSAAQAALRVADHVLLGRTLADALLGDNDTIAAAATEHRTHVVVTDGARGWTLFTPDGTRHDGAAIEIVAADATGAGDCFAGTYCAEVDRGSTPLDAARLAAVAAGLSCTRPGARAALPREDVLAHLTHSDHGTGHDTHCALAGAPGEEK